MSPPAASLNAHTATPGLGLWRRAVLAIALTLMPVLALAQQMPLRYYGQQEGLGNLAISAMTRDHEGYLWIGTDNGLFRYNGSSFQRYQLPDGPSESTVYTLLVDQENKLWVGTPNGLYFKSGESFQPVLRDDGRPIDIWTPKGMVVAPNGDHYVISGMKAYTLSLHDGTSRVRPVFSDAQRQQHPELEAISSIYAEADAVLWLGCGRSLCRSDRKGVAVWGVAQGVAEDNWNAVLRDRQGQLWARGEHHLIVLPAGAQAFIDRAPPGDLLRKSNLVALLTEDSQGRILSNVDDGLARWDQTHWEHYGPANGLRSAGGIAALQFDQDGGLWLGSLGLGLINWLGYGNWENWTTAQGLPDDYVLSFIRDAAGVLYAGTSSGPGRLAPDATRFTPATRQHWGELSGWAVDDTGTLWGGSYSGLLVHVAKGGATSVRQRGLPSVSSLMLDRQQRLWLTHEDGISVLDVHAGAHAAHPPEGLVQQHDPDTVAFRTQCEAPDGALWFLSGGQLLHLADQHWRRLIVRNVELHAMSCSADGSLWLGDTRGKLWRARLNEQGLTFQSMTDRLLAGARIFGLHEDRRGWLWVGTDAGVAVWNRDHWRRFNQNDGLAWNDTNGVFYEDADGSMWIATSNGASHVRRPELLFAPTQLSVRLESAHRDSQTLTPGRPWVLPWSSAPLELNLASLHAQNRGALRFHYRLAGLENAWAVSATPNVRYAALPPGEYQFEYYASNVDSHRASPLQRQAVTVLPPWWRSMPFYLLCAVLTLLSLALLYHLRVRHLLRRQLLTEQLVRERTRELEQSREQLRQRALKDSLTGAWNRGAILEIIDHALEQAQAKQMPLLLVLLDLDHFKRVNDTYGHAAGDAVLREAVARLSASVRQSDAVGRYGGEEFLVLLPGLDQASGHARIEELRHVLRHEPVRINEHQTLNVTASFGAVAFDPRRPLPSAELIDRADQALYRCKENGRDRIEYAPLAV